MADVTGKTVATGLAALTLFAALLAVVVTPLAFLLMLFLGNLGLGVSFWGALPGAGILALLQSHIQKSS